MKGKNMKAIIRTVVIFSLLAIGVGVFAKEGNDESNGNGRGKKFAKHLDKIKDELNLTESQSAQIKSIMEASKAELKANVQAMKNADTKEEKAAARAELKKDQQAMRDRILAVLTPEQRAKAEEMRGMFKEKMKEKHAKKRGGKHGGPDNDDSTPSSAGTGKTSGQVKTKK